LIEREEREERKGCIRERRPYSYLLITSAPKATDERERGSPTLEPLARSPFIQLPTTRYTIRLLWPRGANQTQEEPCSSRAIAFFRINLLFPPSLSNANGLFLFQEFCLIPKKAFCRLIRVIVGTNYLLSSNMPMIACGG
jgi:hypothetical protein